jgi:hypothetical protein
MQSVVPRAAVGAKVPEQPAPIAWGDVARRRALAAPKEHGVEGPVVVAQLLEDGGLRRRSMSPDAVLQQLLASNESIQLRLEQNSYSLTSLFGRLETHPTAIDPHRPKNMRYNVAIPVAAGLLAPREIVLPARGRCLVRRWPTRFF